MSFFDALNESDVFIEEFQDFQGSTPRSNMCEEWESHAKTNADWQSPDDHRSRHSTAHVNGRYGQHIQI